jgi:transposase
MKDNRRRPAAHHAAATKPRAWSPLLKRIQPDAAGIDCGATSHYVAVPEDRDPQPVRAFSTFTADLHRLADWLCSVTSRWWRWSRPGSIGSRFTKCSKSAGWRWYWSMPARYTNVRGRKSDVQDCQWLQELHSVGLLQASFRPAGEIVALRGYVRHRQTLIEAAATCIHRMQKALTEMISSSITCSAS